MLATNYGVPTKMGNRGWDDGAWLVITCLNQPPTPIDPRGWMIHETRRKTERTGKFYDGWSSSRSAADGYLDKLMSSSFRDENVSFGFAVDSSTYNQPTTVYIMVPFHSTSISIWLPENCFRAVWAWINTFVSSSHLQPFYATKLRQSVWAEIYTFFLTVFCVFFVYFYLELYISIVPN